MNKTIKLIIGVLLSFLVVEHVPILATEEKLDIFANVIESTEIKEGFIIKSVVSNKPILSYKSEDGTLYEYKKESFFIPNSNERLEASDDELIYSSSFRLSSTIVYRQKSIDGDEYIQVIEFSEDTSN